MTLIKRLFRFIVKYMFSLFIVLYSMTFGILTKKGRFVITTLLDNYKFSFITKTILPKLPKISYESVIKNDKIEIIEPFGKDGNIELDELAIINGIIRKEDPNKIFEIGTFDGRTTLNMANSSNDKCQIYTLDLPHNEIDKTKNIVNDYDKTLIDKDICGERIIKSDLNCRHKINQLYGDSAIFDFKPFYGSIDLVFIDGAHDYENALSDSKTALDLIGNNGVILWHDYKIDVPVVDAIEALKQIHPELNIYHINATNIAYYNKSF